MSELPRIIDVQAGEFLMGSNTHYPEERPERRAKVSAFRMDAHPVRNRDFAAFVSSTGYTTLAQRLGFSHVFQMTEGPVPLSNPALWWQVVQGACWKDPRPGSELPPDFDSHPVVHVSLEDAKGYAAWVGGRLPFESEWEYAAWGGHLGSQHESTCNPAYAWGEEFAPNGQRMAQVWQGAFPWYYALNGTPSTVAVGSFPSNVAGFSDLIGNVWEWTYTEYSNSARCSGCSPEQDADKLFVLKGGSHLCAAEYCLRYRPPARIGMVSASTTSHAGFRCAYDINA